MEIIEHNTINNKTTVFGGITAFVCCLTVISQFPQFMFSRISQIISYISVGGLFVFSLSKNVKNISIRGLNDGIITLFAYYFVIFILSIIDINYLKINLNSAIIVAILIFVVGIRCSVTLTDKDIENILISYVYACIALGVDIYFSYVHGVDFQGYMNLGSGYVAKNSTSVIILSSVIIILLGKIDLKLPYKNITKILVILFLVMIIFVLRSRASIVALPIVLYYSSGKNTKTYIPIACIILGVICAFLLSKNVRIFFIDSLYYNNIEIHDLQHMTSGRARMWMSFFSDMKGNWFTGQGPIFRESIFLASIVQTGIIAGGLLLSIAFFPLRWMCKYMPKSYRYYRMFLVLNIMYLFNGLLFEQYTPFGPGVKCFILWFLFGVFYSKINNINNNEIIKKDILYAK